MTRHGDHSAPAFVNAIATTVAIAAAAAMVFAMVLAISVGAPAAISPASRRPASNTSATGARATVAPVPSLTAASATAPTPAATLATPALNASPATPATPTPVAGPFEGDLTIPVGTTVLFTNDLGDGEPHSVTARDGSFDTGLLVDGQSATITFNTPGKYPYYCVIHANMFGTITVTK